MELDVHPEPRPDELAALAEALAQVLARPEDEERSGWWREGVRENVEPV